MQSWDEIRRWRKEQRAKLIARRQAIPQDQRRRSQASILKLVEQHFPDLANTLLGFYWPFRGEIGPHPLVRRLVERGARAALPVVVEKGQPLEFWAWRPGAPLRRGVWDIPIPVERQVVQPGALLVPLVGFDRRGSGSATAAATTTARSPRWTRSRSRSASATSSAAFETIPHPQPHDIPMDAIVTEAGVASVTDAFPPRQREALALQNTNLE